MKQYILLSKVLAERACQSEAEEVIGRKINNLLYGTDGYITKDPDTEDLNWVPKSVFDSQAIIADSPMDKYRFILKQIEENIAFLKTESKSAKPKSPKRKRAYLTIRRLEALKIDIMNLIRLTLI